MALRLVEIIVPESVVEKSRKLMEQHEVVSQWEDVISDQLVLLRCLVKSENTEKLTESLNKQFSHEEHFRIILLPVEATLPRLEEPEPEKEQPGKKEFQNPILRISREELYDDIREQAKLSYNNIILIALSSIVAGIGILQDNLAVTIGAMVIAPLLGPHVGVAFATTLGDLDLIKKSIRNGAIGIGLVLLISGIWGMIDTGASDLTMQDVGLGHIVLALCSGAAGVLSILSGSMSALVGVMVAVALLPPLVSSGLFAGNGMWMQAVNAFLVFTINVICINLTGVLMFLIAGIRPNSWWEAAKARKQTYQAIALWSFLLVLLALIVLFKRGVIF